MIDLSPVYVLNPLSLRTEFLVLDDILMLSNGFQGVELMLDAAVLYNVLLQFDSHIAGFTCGLKEAGDPNISIAAGA